VPTHARLKCRIAALLATTALVAVAALLPGVARALDATWLANPNPAGDFNTATNWSPPSVPTGTAFFGTSSVTGLSFSAPDTTIGGWTFNSGTAYSFTSNHDLTFNGAGIVIFLGSASMTNNGTLQFVNTSTAGGASITNNSSLGFFNTSTAGNATIANNLGGTLGFFNTSTGGSATINNDAGNVTFFDTSTAGNANITNSAVMRFFTTSTAGSATIHNIGDLAFFDTSTAGSATIHNIGALGFFNTSTAGSATITNNNNLNFSNSSTAGNATITNNSVLLFKDTSTGGSATITNSVGGDLQFFNTSTAGNASITNISGVMHFNNTSTAGSATITNSALLNFHDTSTAGSATITNNSGGFLNFFNTSTAGSATITNNGGGFLTFANTSTAGTGTITNNNSMEFQNASTAGNANITNGGIAILGFRDTSTAGNATITNNPGGIVNFFEASTAGNANITNNGNLGFRAMSTAGNATITNNNGAPTIFLNNSTGGNARFIANGTGNADFSGTTGPAGDNKVSVGSIEGAGRYFLGSDQLTVGGNNLSTTMSGTIQDGGGSGGTGGSLVKVGTGTLTLSGLNTYTGATTVNGGTLAVNGSIVASSGVSVNAGGTLGGNGIVGNTTINGGALAPGNSIGLLTVQGSLVFTAASSYMVEVSPSNADRTNVTGTATLGGATVKASFAAGTFVEKQYTILNAAGGVSGTFAGPVNTNLPANFKTSLSYDANNAFLNLLLSFVPPPSGGLNQNQQNVANAITGFFNANGGIPLVFGGLTPAGLTQASGEIATGSQQTTFNAMNLFLGLLTDPFIAGRGDPISAGGSPTAYADETMAYAANGKSRSKSERDAYAAVYTKAPPLQPSFEQRWSVWAAGYGGSQTTDGNAALGSNNTTSRIAGGGVGADYRFSPFTIAGFALAGGGTNFAIANGLGSGRSDLFQAGAFVRHTVGPAYISAALAYGWQDITTDRTVTIAGIDQLRAKFNANAFSGRVEGGYRFVAPVMGGIGITPYAAGQVTTFDLPAYAEQALVGANTFALTYGSKSVTASRSELGLRGDKSFAMQDGIFTLRGRAAWAHDFNTDRNIAATFQTLPGASFVVNGAAQAHDAALVTASAEKKWLNGWSAAATFEGEFSNVTTSYAGKGVVRYSW
jgi:autotransporter-associated beta strand protein